MRDHWTNGGLGPGLASLALALGHGGAPLNMDGPLIECPPVDLRHPRQTPDAQRRSATRHRTPQSHGTLYIRDPTLSSSPCRVVLFAGTTSQAQAQSQLFLAMARMNDPWCLCCLLLVCYHLRADLLPIANVAGASPD